MTPITPTPSPTPNGLPGAYYMAQGPEQRGTGDDLSACGLVVWNMDLDPAACRTAWPNAENLAYFNLRWIGPYGADDSVYGKLRAWFPDDADYWTDATGARIGVWPGTEELKYTPATAQRMALFAVRFLGGWDGIYLDDLHAADLAKSHLTALGVPAEDWERVRGDFRRYRDTFASTIRALLPASKLLVANVGNEAAKVRHLGLDGVCCEEWWKADQAAFTAECGNYRAEFCVAWEWDAGKVARPGNIRYR